MDRNTAITLTVVSVFLCTCPGLFLCTAAGLMFLVSGDFSASDQQIINIAAAVLLAIGFLISLTPAVVGYFTLRQRKTAPVTPVDLNEPLPPAI